MSVAEQTPVVEREVRKRPPRRSGRWAGYLHLLSARMLELKREPEVVFWVFVFPLLLATGLGIAFRNKPAGASSVAIVSGAGAQQVEALLQGSRQHASFKVDMQDGEAARKGFRLGKYDLVIEPDGARGLRYRYDPARPESVLARSERCLAGSSWAQRCGCDQHRHFFRAGFALHRFFDPRIAGHEPDELRHVGHWLRLGGHAPTQAAQALPGHAHAAGRLSACAAFEPRLVLMIIEIGLLLTLGSSPSI